ncbi:unnamed protein product [Ambrosiozyma monospora]|uniref:Unnamed protein product n=1 Tax=Ambrosiozyma monospora TaxID=43982 RepID=A0ACB5SV34_AMBMO|nr:unnamed protein product [Ambrosiozyma monospora]
MDLTKPQLVMDYFLPVMPSTVLLLIGCLLPSAWLLVYEEGGTSHWISSQIKDKAVMTLSTSSPRTASLVESWFGLTTRSDFHPHTPAPITTFSITSLPPDAELISHVQHKPYRLANP